MRASQSIGLLSLVVLALVPWPARASGAGSAAGADSPTSAAEELLARAIAHHDPSGRWGRAPLTLRFEERRPDGEIRHTGVRIDSAAELFSWRSQSGGRDLAGRLEGEECNLSIDGAPPTSAEQAESLGLTCERLTRRRDYYIYLWGLPMKLRDPGTRIDPEVTRTEFEGREVLALRVTYDEGVGSDTWYFYFDPESAALAGYRFYHQESENDGEYITLEGEVDVGGMRLPKERAWFYNKDDGYLGTDVLVEGSSGAASGE